LTPGMSDFKIRKIKESSIPKISQRISREGISEPNGLGIPLYFNTGNIKVLYIATEGNKIIGWSFQAKWKELIAVYVDPHYRRKGIGGELLKRLTKKLDGRFVIKPFSYTKPAIYKIVANINKDIYVQ
jgi:GNAT superfamily N-acetyltransferase